VSASDPSPSMLERVEAVAKRFERLAVAPVPAGLTDPDEPGGERWEWGQVWAHLAEFPEYWMDRIREVLDADPSGDPRPFGRTKDDADRIGAIERDRSAPPSELMGVLREQLVRIGALLGGMTPEDWARPVQHPTLGTMEMPRVFETFLVGHLEDHAAQLESLTEGS
jgi:hypothetical protein